MEAIAAQSLPALFLLTFYALIDKVLAPIVKARFGKGRNGTSPPETPPNAGDISERVHAQELLCASTRAEVTTKLDGLKEEVEGSRKDMKELTKEVMKLLGASTNPR